MSGTSRRQFLKRSIIGGAAVSAVGKAAAESNGAMPGQVERRKLGRIGTEVSIVGLGLGSAYTKPNQSDLDTAEGLLERALEHGINYWDTCRGYGPSERMIGPVVEKRRDEIYLVSKSGGRDYDSFMRDFEVSQREARTDRFDLYHIWNLKPKDDLTAIENGALKAARKLRDEGAIGAFGITGHSGAAILTEAMQRFDPDAVLTIFPCTRPDAGRYEDELLPLARERGMGVIAMKTVRQARNADLKGTDLIRYALSLEGVHSTIVGLDTLAHLDENAAMASNFTPMAAGQRAELSSLASVALAGETEPWLRPGYEDGRLA